MMATDVFSKHGNMHVFVAIGTILSWFWLYPKKHRLLAIFVIINVVFWFFTSQISRYLLAVIPLLGLITAQAVAMITLAVWVKLTNFWKPKKIFKRPAKIGRAHV